MRNILGGLGLIITILLTSITPIYANTVTEDVPMPDPDLERVLTIPALDIQEEITTFPLGSASWEISPWEEKAGHFEGTAWLNMTGNIVIGAHSEYPSLQPGLFYHLDDLQVGDVISLQDDDLTRHYSVVEIRSVDYRDVSVVFPTAHNRLTLITCDIPSYSAEQNVYFERLVVIADEIQQ